MIEVSDPVEVRRECARQRHSGKKVGFVPTMGFLHDGHLSLIRRARELSDYVVVSIFVNPAQFGPGEDLAKYPTDISGDLDKCDESTADLVFLPTRETIYPDGYQTHVEVTGVSQGLCGASRPDHFKGVCTVVTKLLNIVGPCVAVFGEKDFQQLMVIRRMVIDLNQPVNVVGSPIVREEDGVAMSSRNAYLDPEQRRAATCLNRSLQAIRAEVDRGSPVTSSRAIEQIRGIIDAEPLTRVDYVEVRDSNTLEPVEQVETGRTVIALAVRVGQTRLIDNIVL